MQYLLNLLAAAAAVEAKPMPQAVTSAISPSASAPAGCSTSYSGTFGIAVVTPGTDCASASVTKSAGGKVAAATATVATEFSDGQPEQPTTMATVSSSVAVVTATVATEFSDGQPEAPATSAATSSSSSSATTAVVATEYSDGQPEVPTSTAVVATESSDGQAEVPTSTAVVATESSDGQAEVPTSTAGVATESSDGQAEVPTSTAAATTSIAVVATESSDGQAEVPNTTASALSTASATLATESSDGQPEATAAAASTTTSSSCAEMVACRTNDTLAITLADGILHDSHGRTGYIASNYQFQFDDPPQAGAIYTSGFSVCSNGSLALGGSTVFYECLSGDFYNLYTEDWAAQCKPVAIQAVQLEQC